MTDGRPFDIIIVSDLHMAAGRDPDTGTVSPYDDFHADAAFAAFLDRIGQRLDPGEAVTRLLILGDFLDFPHVRIRAADGIVPSADAALSRALRKLDRIAAGHRDVFAALGRFIARGGNVDLVPGNHDIELMHPLVQQRFIDRVISGTGAPPNSGVIRFYPWIYYVPGVLYAEHGQQYHDINSFQRLLELRHTTPGHTGASLGSDLDDYLFRLIEAADPANDDGAHLPRSVIALLRLHPGLLVSKFPLHLRTTAKLIKRVIGPVQSSRRSGRARYRETALRPYSVDAGIDAAALKRIDELAECAVRTMRRRIAQLLLRRIGRLGLALVSTKGRSRPATSSGHGGYLYRAAVDIDVILASVGQQVPNYVFGHTHAPLQLPLRPGVSAPRYVNSGAWASSPGQLIERSEQSTFVHVSREPGSAEAIARLLIWDAVARSIEPADRAR